MYNKAYQVNYTAEYICFIKGLGFIDLDIIEYQVVNSLKPTNFSFNHINEQYQAESIWYILSRTLKQFFEKKLHYQTIVICPNTRFSKYKIQKMPLSHIKYNIEKADIFSLSVLLYNKANISQTIDIMPELTH